MNEKYQEQHCTLLLLSTVYSAQCKLTDCVKEASRSTLRDTTSKVNLLSSKVEFITSRLKPNASKTFVKCKTKSKHVK